MKDSISRLRMRSLPMSTAGSESRRQVIRKKVAQSAGQASDANTIAAATVAQWRQISARLNPVLGSHGVDILFSRTLHLAGKSYPWLGVAGDRQLGAPSLDVIRARLGRQPAPVAAAASCEFLIIFTELLATLIGDSLTDRLLDPVWALAAPSLHLESRK
jgi:hypothetical protein